LDHHALSLNSSVCTTSIDAGVILIGEQGNTGSPAWAKDSSFLAFRKLRQLVPEFNEFLANNPIPDKGLTPAQGSELLGG
jgi:deferrochelatase/peroxidase EfeB